MHVMITRGAIMSQMSQKEKNVRKFHRTNSNELELYHAVHSH